MKTHPERYLGNRLPVGGGEWLGEEEKEGKEVGEKGEGEEGVEGVEGGRKKTNQ